MTDTSPPKLIGDHAAGTHHQWLELRRAWAEHLAQYEWTHFATLTTRMPSTAAHLAREFRDGYVRRITRIAQGPVSWFRVIEYGSSGSAHLHVLLSRTAHLHIDQLRGAWKLGHTHVQQYDPQRGAAYYLTKQIGAERGGSPEGEADYDVSLRESPRRVAAAA